MNYRVFTEKLLAFDADNKNYFMETFVTGHFIKGHEKNRMTETKFETIERKERLCAQSFALKQAMEGSGWKRLPNNQGHRHNS